MDVWFGRVCIVKARETELKFALTFSTSSELGVISLDVNSHVLSSTSTPNLLTRARSWPHGSDGQDVLCDPFGWLLWHGWWWEAWLKND